jgi:hypothetical protein
MATDNQIEANRQNAQLCTGPRTEEGKARSCQNALKTGLYSQKEVIVTESRDDCNALIRYEWLSRATWPPTPAVWNQSLTNSEVPHMGLTYIQHSLTLSRASRAFNTARRGYTTTPQRSSKRSRPNAKPGKRKSASQNSNNPNHLTTNRFRSVKLRSPPPRTQTPDPNRPARSRNTTLSRIKETT